MKLGKCKRCPAPILWCRSVRGVPMPVEPDRVPDGNVVLDLRTTPPTAIVLKKGETVSADRPRYVSHHARCPGADAMRNRKPLRDRPRQEALDL